MVCRQIGGHMWCPSEPWANVAVLATPHLDYRLTATSLGRSKRPLGRDRAPLFALDLSSVLLATALVDRDARTGSFTAHRACSSHLLHLLVACEQHSAHFLQACTEIAIYVQKRYIWYIRYRVGRRLASTR